MKRKKNSLLALIVFFCISNISIAQLRFMPSQNFATNHESDGIATGDLNNDGLTDVAIASYFDVWSYSSEVYIFYQQPNGTLSTPFTLINNGSYPGLKTIAIGDVNNDNRQDLLIGYSDKIGIFYQNLSGQMSAIDSFYSASGVDCIKTGDLNSDGRIDFAVCYQNEFFIKVYYSQPSGFNEINYPVLMSWYNDLDIGDVNSDGRNDVIFMPGFAYDCVRVLYQDSLGSLSYPFNYPNPVPLQYSALDGISVGDVNDDGKSDIVASGGGNIPGASLILWYQDSQSQLKDPVRLKAYQIPGPIEIGDMDNDGKNEIVIVHAGWQKVSVYNQNSAGIDSNYQLINVPYLNNLPNNALALADLDNDGWKDIAIAAQTYGLMVLYHDSSHISVNDFSIENSISVFPNPSSDKIYINCPYRNFSVDIFDEQMQFLFTKNLGSGSSKIIDLSDYDCGIYYLRFDNGHKKHTEKIVKIN